MIGFWPTVMFETLFGFADTINQSYGVVCTAIDGSSMRLCRDIIKDVLAPRIVTL